MFDNNIQKNNLVSTKVVQKSEVSTVPDKSFLMSPLEIHNLQTGRKSPERFAKLDALDKHINEIVGHGSFKVFKKLAEKKQSGEQQDDDANDLLVEDIEQIESHYNLEETMLIDLPLELLAKILKPLNKEIRQRIYVQRDKISLSKAILVYERWTKDATIAYHTSPTKIEGGFLNSQDGKVYFSTSIKHLFSRNGNAKYIYAFRITNPEKYRMDNFEKFGKLEIGSSSGVEIEDMYSISDPNDPSYRQKALDAIGAEFADYGSK